MFLNVMIVTGGRTPIGRYAKWDFSTKKKINSEEDFWLSI
jgi:acetyl-CoA acetyltransferase